jgi:hypothetical protein
MRAAARQLVLLTRCCMPPPPLSICRTRCTSTAQLLLCTAAIICEALACLRSKCPLHASCPQPSCPQAPCPAIQGKLRIGGKICSELLGKLLADMASMREESIATAQLEAPAMAQASYDRMDRELGRWGHGWCDGVMGDG